jgi:hypothetical protein
MIKKELQINLVIQSPSKQPSHPSSKNEWPVHIQLLIKGVT